MIRIDVIQDGEKRPRCRWCGEDATHHVYPDAPRAHPRWSACDRCLARWRKEIDLALRDRGKHVA